MKIVLLSGIVGILLSACSGNDSSNQENLATCLGFTAPQIVVSVLDSISQTPIDTALVTFSDANGSMTLSYNVTDEAYEGLFSDMSDITGGVITVIADNYNSAVVRNLHYSFSTICSSPGNKKEEVIYLCPNNTACI